MNGLCPHNRHIGAVCLECPSGFAVPENTAGDPLHGLVPSEGTVWADNRDANSGLHADYYDLPPNVKSAQDIIEYLNLNFANGNIFKSLVRQFGTQTKETSELYETEKRYFFAKRELERVRRHHEMERQGKRARQQAEERMREEADSTDDAQDGEVS